MPPRMVRPSGALPALPAATTTTIPACTAWLTASHSGSVEQASSHGMAERQVDDADVVARAVGDDPFDAVR